MTQKTETKKSSIHPVVAVGCGCLFLIVVVSIVLTIAGGFIAKRFGTSLVQTVIENKTGIKTNLNDLSKGSMTFTDKETGQTVDIGAGKLPAKFPSDLVYPGATVVGSLAGGGTNESMIVTFASKDTVSEVVSQYQRLLAKSDWVIDSTIEFGPMTTIAIKNGTSDGTITISGDQKSNDTTMIVTINDEEM